MAKYRVKSTMIITATITKEIEDSSETEAEALVTSMIKEKDWKPQRIVKTEIRKST